MLAKMTQLSRSLATDRIPCAVVYGFLCSHFIQSSCAFAFTIVSGLNSPNTWACSRAGLLNSEFSPVDISQRLYAILLIFEHLLSGGLLTILREAYLPCLV